MKSYSTFHFSGYNWTPHGRKVSLRYALDNAITFEETLILPNEPLTGNLEKNADIIERMVFALHLIGGISYFKTCVPRRMEIHSGSLSLPEGKFWNSVYENGLGQFFYENTIDFRGLINFPTDKRKAADSKQKPANQQTSKPANYQRVLVPIGGGKDSMVTLELLKKSGAHLTLLRLGGPHPIIDELAHAAGLPILYVKRSLSGNLFDLNAQGALNGHIPITAYLSTVTMLVAILYDFDAVAMSTERSANEGNFVWKGLEINHQWSKSLAFEKAFRRFMRESVGADVEYFSALRPFSELKITELFSHYPQYFARVTSCNKNWKIVKSDQRPATSDQRLWCCQCPKCAFVFTIFAAFIERDLLVAVFGKNLFDDAALLPLYRELLGIEKFKPFECVGTPDETKAAFLLARERGGFKGSAAVAMFESDVLPTIKEPKRMIEEAMKPSEAHCIPEEFEKMIPGNE